MKRKPDSPREAPSRPHGHAGRRAVRRTVFKTPWFAIQAIPAESRGSEPYYCLTIPDSVVILAITPEDKVILVRQFRPPRGVYTLELPAGYVDAGESPLTAARRELAEETGYTCKTLHYQGVLRIFSSRLDYRIHTYFGHNAVRSALPIETGIRRVLLPRKRFEDYIRTGKFDTATCIAQYYLAKDMSFYKGQEE